MTNISVIIPTYNRSWGLIRSINSVLSQSFQDFELIIVDDCSSDDTEDIVHSIQDPRVLYFRQSHNVGVAENWGKGLELAQGEFITFLMDDDYYKSDFLSNRIVHLISNSKLNVVFSNYEVRDLDGQLVSASNTVLADQTELSPKDLLKCILQRNWFIGASMYRRTAIQAVWERAKRDYMVVDFSLGIYLALQSVGSGLYIDTQDFIMTQHPGQNSQAKIKEVLLQTDNALSRVLTEFPSHSYARLIRREQSCWKVLQARHLDLKTQSNYETARRLVLDALQVDFSNIWAWRQLSKFLIFGKL